MHIIYDNEPCASLTQTEGWLVPSYRGLLAGLPADRFPVAAENIQNTNT